jgi:O-antigen/teichoic acid export membrane protein
MSDGLRGATLRGLSWTGMAQVFGYLIQIGALGVAARHLKAQEFGAEIAAATVVGLGTIAADLGLGRALVQRRELRPGHMAAAFWLALCAASIFALLLSFSSEFWGEVFQNSRVAHILPTMALGLAFAGIGSVPRARLERAFKFEKLAAVDLLSAIGGSGTMVVLVFSGYGLWGLVYGFVVRTGIGGVTPWLFAPFPESFRFRLNDGKELLNFGWKWVGSRLVGYGQQNLDFVIIGRYLGDEALGYYALAYKLIAFPQARLVQVVSRVTFPAFAALQSDLQRLTSAYRSTITYIALVVFPIMVGFTLLSDPGIEILYGSDMANSIVLLQLLAPAGAIRAVAAPAGLIFSSLGRTGLALIWNLCAAFFMMGALTLGIAGGIEGVALAVSLSAVLLTVLSQVVVGRLVDFGLIDFFRSIAPSVGGSLVLVVSVVLLKLTFWPYLPPWILVSSCVLVGAMSYGLGIRYLSSGIYYEASGIFRSTVKGT